MIMATAKKLPSGSWRIRVYDYTDGNGKKHYASFTGKTKKDTEYMAAQYSVSRNRHTEDSIDLTLEEAMIKYCELKSNVLSPTTLREYQGLRNTAYDSIKRTKLKKIDSFAIQKWVNEYSKTHAPKTVRNAHGFLSAVLYTFLDNVSINTTLPSKVKYDAYVPTDVEVQTLIKYYEEHDSDMLIASCLAAFGTMRRSEICGLDADNVFGNVIRVRTVCVRAVDKFVIKNLPKTYSSARDIEMPDFVINLLPKSGPVVSLNPNMVTNRHVKAVRKLGIKPFRFHDLRHYAASVMHALGIPDQYIMARGGWTSDKVLKEIYRGTMDDYSQKFQQIAFEHFEKINQN